MLLEDGEWHLVVLDKERHLPCRGNDCLQTLNVTANIFKEEVHSMDSTRLPSDVGIPVLNDSAGLNTVGGAISDDLDDVGGTQAFNSTGKDVGDVQTSLLLSRAVLSSKEVCHVVDLQYLVEQGITCMRNDERQREINDTKMSAKKTYVYILFKQTS